MDETLQGTTGVGIKGTLGSDVSRILLTRRLLLRFIHLKLMFNNSHEFAIVLLNEKAVWHMDFSNDEMLLEMAISELYPTGHYNTFDTTSLFTTIAQHVGMARGDVMVQVILVYGRSAVIPTPLTRRSWKYCTLTRDFNWMRCTCMARKMQPTVRSQCMTV
ncbi:hypothetical protein BC936DRAFT_137865 [Jimgerdemannia flammicorona]|uniref:Uncharacterized protein n=1 Tax=Jimgerdemannia flammicorona TaxID=994334 RepID=A0A433CWI6_9FUNG|nr:hypothetical protein BC936DRAFT_137865 [Jimgerdemannia flammicorona]